MRKSVARIFVGLMFILVVAAIAYPFLQNEKEMLVVHDVKPNLLPDMLVIQPWSEYEFTSNDPIKVLDPATVENPLAEECLATTWSAPVLLSANGNIFCSAGGRTHLEYPCSDNTCFSGMGNIGPDDYGTTVFYDPFSVYGELRLLKEPYGTTVLTSADKANLEREVKDRLVRVETVVIGAPVYSAKNDQWYVATSDGTALSAHVSFSPPIGTEATVYTYNFIDNTEWGVAAILVGENVWWYNTAREYRNGTSFDAYAYAYRHPMYQDRQYK